MKGGNGGCGRFAEGGNQPAYPVPHLSGGLVGEGDGQNRPSRHLVGCHQVSHAVGYDPGFAASGPCQDEQRTFDMLHGLALAGVQAFEEIHGNTHFSTSSTLTGPARNGPPSKVPQKPTGGSAADQGVRPTISIRKLHNTAWGAQKARCALLRSVVT